MTDHVAILRRRLLMLALTAALPLSTSSAGAQAWPSRPLRILVPAGPGSVPDVRARWLGERLATAIGQPVLIDNRPGAGGTVAMEVAARSEPDGHTLVMMHVAVMVLNPLVHAQLGYDAQRDFLPLTRVGVGPLLLVVNPASPHTTVQGLLDSARRKPRSHSFASLGIGTPPHLGAELLLQASGTEAVHVPYTQPTQPIVDLLAGRVDWLFEGTPVALPLVASGRLRALAVTSAKRLAALPDVPTMIEAGLPRVVFDGWTGLALPSATPARIAERLYAEIARILHSDDARQWFAAVGNVPGGETPEQTAQLLQAERQLWGPVVEAAGLRASR